MGLVTWAVFIIIILAIIGLGWQTFFYSGVLRGVRLIIHSPIIQDLTNGAQHVINKVIYGHDDGYYYNRYWNDDLHSRWN